MSIKNNITNLQSLLKAVNALPEASNGVELPSLTNEGSASDLLSSKQLIDQDGEIVIGSMPNNGTISSTMDGINKKSVTIPQGYTSGGTVSLDNTIDNEVNTQSDLISQIVNALENKAVEVEFKEVEYSENENAIISRTISNYTNNMVTNIGGYAFYNCSSLTSVSFPACTTIGSGAFSRCYNLTSANFPVCTSIGGDAFDNCSSLTTVSFPACTNIDNWAFDNCSSLTTVSFPACTTIGGYAFGYCYSLTTISFPACTNIGSYAFNGCYNLTSVSFPACTNIGSYAFENCSKLTSVSFPACTNIGSYAFNGCSNLTSANFPVCTNIGGSAFTRCFNLSQLYLTGSSLCTLSGSNAFKLTPYAGYSASFSGTPYIYVPQSLLASYKTATNWTYFSSYFSGI